MDEQAAQERIAQLTVELNEHSRRYHVADSASISDADYDLLFRELQTLEQEFPALILPNSPTTRIGGLSTDFVKVKHARKMLSLQNAFTAQEVLRFFGQGSEVMLHPKIDGLSLKLIYRQGELVQALTRGDGTHGEDVTVNARTIRSIPLRLSDTLDIEVLGEVYLRVSEFNAQNQRLEDEGDELFANPRNAAAGGLKQKNSAEVAQRNLSFVAYGTATTVPGIQTQVLIDEYLECLGFQSVFLLPVSESAETLAKCVQLTSLAETEDIISAAEQSREYLDLATDGLVFKINDLARQQELGDGSRGPNWAIAYKFPPERKSTILQNIILTVGKTGKLTPVAELAPVKLSGTTVQRASICNADEIERLRIDIGDTIYIEKSAEIIPKIIGVSWNGAAWVDGKIDVDLSGGPPSIHEPRKCLMDKPVWRMPAACPSCKSPLARPEGFVDYYCMNLDCEERVFARLKHATSKQALDLDGCGDVMVRGLMAAGVRKLSDLFSIELRPTQFKTAVRTRFNAARLAAKSAPFWRKLHALNIEGFGKETCQTVATLFNSLDDCVNRWPVFKDLIGEAKSNSFLAWTKVNEDEAEALKALGLTFKAETAEKDGPLTGKFFVITGTLYYGSRDQVARLVEEAGGVVKSAVTKSTSFLVQGEEPGLTKTVAATKHKIPIISEGELFQMLGQELPAPQEIDPEREY